MLSAKVARRALLVALMSLFALGALRSGPVSLTPAMGWVGSALALGGLVVWGHRGGDVAAAGEPVRA